MTSAGEPMQAAYIPCDSDSDENGTSIIICANENKWFDSNQINKSISHANIILQQEPRENLFLTFSISHSQPQPYYYSNCYNDCSSFRFYSFNFTLKFDNNIHEISKQFYYKVTLKASMKKGANEIRHLFTRKILRTQNTISENIRSPVNTSMRSGNMIHLCLHVKRFSELENVKPDSSVNHLGAQLLTTGIYSDISIIVGDKTYRAHKQVLALKSDVFKAMFAHDMLENKDGTIKIVDFDADVIEDMLLYIYTGRTKNISKIYVHLFKAAHMYGIDDLKPLCVNYIFFNMNCQNLVSILEIACLYRLNELKENANHFISNHEETVVNEKSYQQLLSRDLNVGSVVHTLKLCVKYNLEELKLKVFEFVKSYSKQMALGKIFLDLFESHPKLMKELYIYVNK